MKYEFEITEDKLSAEINEDECNFNLGEAEKYSGRTIVTPNDDTQILYTEGRIVDTNIIVNPIQAPYYTGATVVTPNDDTQILETEGTRMTSDIQVNPIPVPYYDGDTEVTPNDETQVLQTQGTRLTSDIQVNPIPVPYYDGSTEVTPDDNTQVLQTQGTRLTSDIQINPIPTPFYDGSTEVTPSNSLQILHTNEFRMNSDITVNPMPQAYEFVSEIYNHTFNLSDDTTFDSWTASTTAGSIMATANVGTFAGDMENWEYLLWWKIGIDVKTLSGATLKALPIWEGMDVVQSIFRRPNSLGTLASGDKAANACVTQTTAPLLTYYDSSGALKYTYSNSYGLYGAVQAATFSNATSLTPTVTVKRPTFNARCSSSYFATGRKAQIDSANTDFKMVCNLYRIPIKQYCQTKLYEGLVDSYNNLLSD